ncbi:MAG: YecA family protein [Pseudomonadota bacterium]|nr:YecA family protein [Pseudomonadota bacterium]
MTGPGSRRAKGGAQRRPAGASPNGPLGDAEIRELQTLLDGVPSPLDPLDVSMLDGFLCGVLVQPTPIPSSRWLRHVTDIDGRPLSARFQAGRLHELVQRRHAELATAIRERRWFDPWVFELSPRGSDAGLGGAAGTARAERSADIGEASAATSDAAPDIKARAAASEAALPWVAGIATAFEIFPALTRLPSEATLEPLALLYRHLDAEDLEDADELLAEIASLDPVADLTQAIEGLVRATLLLADAARERD